MTNTLHDGGIHVWTVGDRLRAARERITYDRKKFASLINVSVDTIRSYERNKTEPKTNNLNAWVLATGMSREWILTGQAHGGDDGGGGPPSTIWYTSPLRPRLVAYAA